MGMLGYFVVRYHFSLREMEWTMTLRTRSSQTFWKRAVGNMSPMLILHATPRSTKDKQCVTPMHIDDYELLVYSLLILLCGTIPKKGYESK